MAFSDFIDQPQAVGLLKKSLSGGRLGHAYLLSGDKIHFLEDFGMAFAAALFCEHSGIQDGEPVEDPDSCGQCASCQKVRSGNHPDLHFLRPESKMRMIRMEPTRSLIRNMQTKAFSGGFKVGLISGIDRMNPEAANAFLKTLEEPPPKTVFMLLTSEPGRILDTVTSRCLRLHFPGSGKLSFPDSVIRGVGRVAEMLAGMAEASKSFGVLDTYKITGVILDQLKKISEGVQNDLEERQSQSAAGQAADPATKARVEVELKASIEAEYRLQRSQLFQSIEWLFRDVWITQQDMGELELAFPDLHPFSRMIASAITPDQSIDNIHRIEVLQSQLHTNVQEALAVEVCLLKLHLPQPQ